MLALVFMSLVQSSHCKHTAHYCVVQHPQHPVGKDDILPMVADHARWNSITQQIPSICNPSLCIALNFEQRK